jgi:hypothetical protein
MITAGAKLNGLASIKCGVKNRLGTIKPLLLPRTTEFLSAT